MAWPTTNDPRTEFVTLRLTVSESADLDRLVQQTGASSRSEAVRTALDEKISRTTKQQKRAKP